MEPQRFTVTADHIKLLRRAYVRWEDCEYGAPAIDCKRPYGNSDVLGDMADILGVPIDREAYDPIGQEAAERLNRLHEETQTVLQIILATGTMEPGDYEAPAYSSKWARVR